MKTQNNRHSFLIYALIFLAALLLIMSFFGEEEYPFVSYGDVQELIVSSISKSRVPSRA